MPLVLTDCPALLAPCLGPAARWRQEGPASSLPAPARALWQAMDSGGALSWAAVSADAAGWAGDWVVIVREAPASQFEALQALLQQGWTPPGPVACLALSGRGFVGQRGRPWAALEGNLHLTLALPLGRPARDMLPGLSMAPAVAVVRALERLMGGRPPQPRIKWVNDVLMDGGKVAGVLTATRVQGRMVQHVVFGVGVNVEQAPAIPPTPFVPGTACLRQFLGGHHAGDAAGRLCRLLLAELSRAVEQLEAEGPAGLLESYRRASLVLGRSVAIYPEETDSDLPEPLAEGVVQAIGPDLSLSLRGVPGTVSRGRLRLLE